MVEKNNTACVNSILHLCVSGTPLKDGSLLLDPRLPCWWKLTALEETNLWVQLLPTNFSTSNPTNTSTSPKPSYTAQLDRTGLLSKMAVPGDSKQGYHLKKGDANFCLVLPASSSSSYSAHQRSGAGTPRPSSPQYGATPSAPIYDEPPPIDPPIYDEPPVEMESRRCAPLTQSSLPHQSQPAERSPAS